MTAKRFKFNGATNCIEYNGKSILLDSYGEDIEELLNELHEENKALKHQLQQQELEYATTCHRLAEENESLKEENKFLRNKVATYKKGNALLKKSMDKEWK